MPEALLNADTIDALSFSARALFWVDVPVDPPVVETQRDSRSTGTRVAPPYERTVRKALPGSWYP